MPPLLQELKEKLAGELLCDQHILDFYSRDESLFEVKPQAVAFPKSPQDIALIIGFCKTYHTPLGVRGLGKGSKGGSLSEGIVLDMSKYFDQVGRLDIAHTRITVQAGATYVTCKKKIAQWGFDLPFSFENEDMTFGGALATNHKNHLSSACGSIADWIEQVRVILDDGKEYLISSDVRPHGRLLEIYSGLLTLLKEDASYIRSGALATPDQSMGYPVFSTHISPKLLLEFIIGSEGTLGVITEITLRLDKKKTRKNSFAFGLQKLEELTLLLNTYSKERGISLFGFNAKALAYEKKRLPHLYERHNGSAYIFCLTAIENDTHTQKIISSIKEKLTERHLMYELDEKEFISYESILLRQERALQEYYGERYRNTYLCDNIAVSLSSFISASQELTSLLESSGIPCSTSFLPFQGLIKIQSVVDTSSKEYKDLFMLMMRESGAVISRYQGSLTYSNGDGILHTPLLTMIYGSDLAFTMKKVKKIWDKETIFNPGKKIFLDMNYIKKHLRPKEL
jgi:FAD/FMN-containing dehydrogenase